MPAARVPAAALPPAARTFAMATLGYASVAAGVPVIAVFTRDFRSSTDFRPVVLGACAFVTLALTLGLVASATARGWSGLRLFFATILAAGANATICACIEDGPRLAAFAATFGVIFWGPVGLVYFAAFAPFLRALRAIEAVPSKDLARRRAALGATFLGTIALLGGPLATLEERFAYFPIAAGVAATLLALFALAGDARDRLFLRLVARGRHPGFALREAKEDDDAERLVPFVAGLRAPKPRYVILERRRSADGPFRDHEATRALHSVADRAEPLRRRAALCLAVFVLAGGITAVGSAFLVQRHTTVATLYEP